MGRRRGGAQRGGSRAAYRRAVGRRSRWTWPAHPATGGPPDATPAPTAHAEGGAPRISSTRRWPTRARSERRRRSAVRMRTHGGSGDRGGGAPDLEPAARPGHRWLGGGGGYDRETNDR